MSGSGKKKKGVASGVKGWEEAGGEFYQECYPGVEVDLEVMKSDPQRISTLLPSKKNRTGTVTVNKKDTKLATLRYRSTNRSLYQQTTVGANNDIQISFMPDLSENLSNEELLWEEIMKIKAMPVNMAQKKEMKAKLESKDTLRLQGFKQFRWKRRQTLMYFKVRLKELNEKLTVWCSSLKKIEGYHGTGVVSFFLFVKWLIFLNIVISFIVCTMVIYPTVMIKQKKKFDDGLINLYSDYDNNTNDSITTTPIINRNNNSVSSSSSSSTSNSTITRKMSANPYPFFFQLFIGKYWLNGTPLYYDYYETGQLDLPYVRYDLSLAYISAAFIYFLLSFLLILKNAAHGFKDKILEGEGQFYVYCNLLFSGWDFCIKNRASADVKHKALYNEIVGRLNVEHRKEERYSRTKKQSFKLFFGRVIVNAIILSLLSMAGLVIFFSFKYFTVATVSVTTTELSDDESDIVVNREYVLDLLSRLTVEYATAGFIVTFNIILPIVFNWLATFEDYSPIFAMQITVFRTILLRYSSLCVLLASFYERVVHRNPTSEFAGRQIDGGGGGNRENVTVTVVTTTSSDCWGNLVAEELYKLLIVDVATNILVTFLVNFPRGFLAAHTDNKLFRLLGRQEFHLPTHVLDVVYIQTIIWLGSFYAPLLPTVGAVVFATLFYVKKFACLVNSVPAGKIYYASKSHSLYMFVLLFSFAFSVVPWAISIVEFHSSEKCGGPFVDKHTAWTVVRQAFDDSPLWLRRAVLSCIQSSFVVPMFVILSLANYYYYSVCQANKQMVVVLKRQLILEGHDKQFLLNRLSAFIKQQQKYYKPISGGTEI